MKIIIVDDSLLDRKLLSKSLVNAGVKNEILQADNGEAALGLVVENLGQIALMFVDYQMPQMSGIELMEGLSKIPATSNIPIIMLTASAAEDSKQAAYNANPNLAGYIIKPFKVDQLIETVKPYAQF